MENILLPHLPWRDFEFCVGTASHKGDSSMHSHEFCELVFVHEGEAVHRLGENCYRIQAGDLFIIPPGIEHCYLKANLGIYNILFSKTFHEKFPSDLSVFANFQLLFHTSTDVPLPQRLISLETAYFPEMTHLLDDIISEEHRKENGSISAVFSDCLRIVLLICRHSHHAGDWKNPYSAYRISHLMAELEAHYGEPWRLEDMAEYARMSVSSFRQQFKLLTGKAPVDYLIELRVKKASEMLCLRRKTIGEIGCDCGFEDSNYFFRMFKKMTGMSPRGYRGMIEQRNFENRI